MQKQLLLWDQWVEAGAQGGARQAVRFSPSFCDMHACYISCMLVAVCMSPRTGDEVPLQVLDSHSLSLAGRLTEY